MLGVGKHAPAPSIIMSEKLTYSPAEFAALFEKERTWGYRQIHAGRVNVIHEFGNMMIPASEVTRIMETAGRYGLTNSKKPGYTKANHSCQSK